jgi:hypothetical protein
MSRPIANQREEQRHHEKQLRRDWKKLKAAQKGTPHFPLWLQYLTRGLAAFYFFSIICLILFNSHGTGSIVFGVAFWIVVAFACVDKLGFPHSIRNAAKRFHEWDNWAIMGTLCEMLLWGDKDIQGYARTGLTRLLPQIRESGQSPLTGMQRDILRRMLTPTNAKQDPEFVLAILGMFQRTESLDVIPDLMRLRNAAPTAYSALVREEVQHCLDSLRAAKERQTHQATLLRPTSQTATDYLLTPASAPSETRPDELLRPTQAEITPSA